MISHPDAIVVILLAVMAVLLVKLIRVLWYGLVGLIVMGTAADTRFALVAIAVGFAFFPATTAACLFAVCLIVGIPATVLVDATKDLPD